MVRARLQADPDVPEGEAHFPVARQNAESQLVPHHVHPPTTFVVQIFGSDGKPKSIAFIRGEESELPKHFAFMAAPLESLMRKGRIKVKALEVDFHASPILLGHQSSTGNHCMFYTPTGVKDRVANGPLPLSDTIYATVSEVRDHLRDMPHLKGEHHDILLLSCGMCGPVCSATPLFCAHLQALLRGSSSTVCGTTSACPTA